MKKIEAIIQPHKIEDVKEALKKIGVNAEVAVSDWGTLLNRRANKETNDKGGWNISMTAASVALLSDPIINHYSEASGDRAQFGWPLDEEIEKLRRVVTGA